MDLSPNARGVIATCLAMIGFIGTDSLIKLASEDLPISQMVALRGLVILLILSMVALATGAYRTLPTLRDRPVWLRAGSECVSTLLYYNAVIAIPIAAANAVLQAIPLAIVAVAALVFGERVGWRRWLVILAGFLGVLLIIQPGSEAFQPASLWAVAAVGFYVMRDMATRQIDRRLPTVSINLVTSSTVMMMGFLLAPFEDWVMPSATSLLLLSLSAAFLSLGYMAITVAMRSGDVSVTSPFRYSIVLWALVIDALVFKNSPNTVMMVGIGIVVASGLYMIVRERQTRSQTPS